MQKLTIDGLDIDVVLTYILVSRNINPMNIAAEMVSKFETNENLQTFLKNNVPNLIQRIENEIY